MVRRAIPLVGFALVVCATAIAVASDTGESGKPGAIAVAPASDPGDRAATRARQIPRRAILRLQSSQSSQLGDVIFEKRSGLVAYIFTRDTRRNSNCTGECARAWPPIKTKRRPKAGRGLKQRHVGMIKRQSGARMATYKGQPLYFYHDDPPGQILCHNVFQFGGTWYAVARSGAPAPTN